MSGILDLKQLRRVAIRVETIGRVKDLKGFVKGHSTPDRDSARARKFIAQIASEEVKADIEDTYQAIRERFGFKRRQIETSADGCTGVIQTPKFQYLVAVTLDQKNMEQVIWKREIDSFNDPQTVQAPEFTSAFGNLFNTLVLEFAKPIRVDRFVDWIEDEELPGLKIDCTADSSSCEITLSGFRGKIRLNHCTLMIEGAAPHAAGFLLGQFVEFVKRFKRRRSKGAST